jgi:hypothetical protein
MFKDEEAKQHGLRERLRAMVLGNAFAHLGEYRFPSSTDPPFCRLGGLGAYRDYRDIFR